MKRSLLTTLSAFGFAALVVFGTALSVSAQVTFYTDRPTFQAAHPGLPLEDFTGGNTIPGEILSCTPPLNSATNDACFPTNGVISGFDLDVNIDTGGGLYVVLNNAVGMPCVGVGPNSFADDGEFNFSPARRAAGFDLYTPLGGGEPYTVNVFGPGGLLGSTATTGGGVVGTFVGADTADPGGIIRIELVEGVDGTGDIFCDLEFGEDPIPVELVSFDAVVNGTDVVLNWATASETNNAGFEIQTLVGEDWNVLGFVEGNGTTTEAQTYSFNASDMAVGSHTFRLKQIDYDGAFEYSDELEVSVETPGTHLLSNAYPNPFNPQSQFTVAVAQEQNVTAKLFNTLGRRIAILFSGAVEPNQAQQVTIDGAGLASGMYVVRVNGERFSDTLTVTLLK